MSGVRAADAARNNAAWCDAVCGAHGRPGELQASHWLCRDATPPRYPNLVTLDAAVGPALAAVRALARACPAPAWAVKDSFAVLPLEQEGFRLLLEGEWIARPAPARPGPASGRWTRVRSEPALGAWEAAWGESAGAPRIFLPALLRRSEIALLAARDGEGAIVAGVVASLGAGAVGLSNFFARSARGDARAEGLAAAAAEFPGLPLVGWESGADLAEARALGFAPIGPLRVWERTSG